MPASLHDRFASLRQKIADWRVVISFVLLTVFLLRRAGKLGADGTAAPDSAAYLAIGWFAVLLGAWLRSWSAGILRKGCDLSTSGPYSLCRHPLYLGSFLMLVGFCHLLAPPVEYGPIVAAIALVHLATMQNEETRLAARFGARWTDYARRTPMIVPWRPAAFAAARWNVRVWLRAREYRAMASSLLGLFALEWLR
jgi:protein-S-isoprenylcysteine O-methyltransferase Ste14